MSDHGYCKCCGEFALWMRSHQCAPAWDAWLPEENETRENARKAFGETAKDAAEHYAEKLDSDSGTEAFPSHDGIVVAVAKRGETKVSYFEVMREFEPVYRAEEADEETVENLPVQGGA